MRDAAPLIAWQQLKMGIALGESCVGGIRGHGTQCQRNRGRLGFGQPSQQSTIQVHIQIADRIAGACCQRINPPTARLKKRRVGRQD